MPKIKIKNLNTEINRRIKLIKTATSVVDIGQQQGAVVNQSDYVGICLSPLEIPVISCDGATDISGCVSWGGGVVDVEVDGVKVLTSANEAELEAYLFTNGEIENALTPSCGCMDYVRQVNVPYFRYAQGQTLFLPVALQPNGQPITSPFIVQGSTLGERIDFITSTLNSQLEPHGLYCVYGLFAGTSIYLGVPDNRSKSNYKDTEFYILDEGNTFTEEEIPRGLPPYYCFMPT